MSTPLTATHGVIGDKDSKDATERKDPGASKGCKGPKVTEEPQDAVFYVQVFFLDVALLSCTFRCREVCPPYFLPAKVLLRLRILVFRV